MRVRPSNRCFACGETLTDHICFWTVNDGDVWLMHENCGLRLQYDGGVWHEGFSITISDQNLDVTVDSGAYTTLTASGLPIRHGIEDPQIRTLEHEGENLLAIIGEEVRLVSNKTSSRRGREGVPLWVIKIESGRIMDCYDVRGESMQEEELP